MKQAILRGSRVKRVQCACGNQYAYRVVRTVPFEPRGNGALHGLDEGERARILAELSRQLETDVEACKCPSCGAITSEMARKLALERLGHRPRALRLLGKGALTALVGVGLLGFLISQVDWERQRRFKVPTLILLAGVFAFVRALPWLVGGVVEFVRGYRVVYVDALDGEPVEFGPEVVSDDDDLASP